MGFFVTLGGKRKKKTRVISCQWRQPFDLCVDVLFGFYHADIGSNSQSVVRCVVEDLHRFFMQTWQRLMRDRSWPALRVSDAG